MSDWNDVKESDYGYIFRYTRRVRPRAISRDPRQKGPLDRAIDLARGGRPPPGCRGLRGRPPQTLEPAAAAVVESGRASTAVGTKAGALGTWLEDDVKTDGSHFAM
jgi:hypothetical protein